MKALRPDLTQGEIPLLIRDKDGNMVPNPDYPDTPICKSGHAVPHGTRLFAIAGAVMAASREGVYCEFCLSIANRISLLAKQGLPVNFDPHAELQRLMAEAERSGG